MIVFDLKCGAGHVFEAWFGSSADYESQRGRGLVACPLCGDAQVGKAVMASNVAAKGNRGGGGEALPVAVGPDAAEMKAVVAKMAALQAKMLEGSEWVGGQFAEEARAMHHGERDAKPIHGETSLAEAKALAEEGIAVAPLPLPVIPPDATN